MNKKSLKKQSMTNWAQIDAMTDQDIDYSDIPEMDEAFFKNAVIIMPESKSLVTIRLDRDVLAWFKIQGSGYQTRINALLRSYMEAKKRRAS